MFALSFLIIANAPVCWADFSGAIGPASSGYLIRAVDAAERAEAACLVIALDTPGGLDESMREITKRIMNAAVPVVVYVAPQGARAASAGVFILYSAHVAAMAPGTNVGAAHPVGVGGEMDSIQTAKVTNDAVAYLQSLARSRGRNSEWAELAVRESAALDADSALALGVCDLVAADREDLLDQLEGRRVASGDGTLTIHVADAPLRLVSLTFAERLLLILSNPNIAYILLMIGVYGIFFELRNPGMLFPGIAGALCLILGLYALHVLPVNFAGVGFIVLSAVLFLLEIYVTSYGLLTIGGVAALVIGSVILFESNVPFLRVSWEVIMVVVLLVVLFVLFVLSLGLKAQYRRVVTGQEGLIGMKGQSRTVISNSGGTVMVRGEYWNATSDERIDKGQEVTVIGVVGMTLKVRAG